MKRVLLIATALASFIIFSCTPPEPLEATVIEFSTCKGWDTNRKPIKISDTFTSNEKQIFACGYVQTNQPVTISVNWYHGEQPGQLINRETLTDLKSGYFYSTLEPQEAEFPSGDYLVEVVMGKYVVKNTKFRISEGLH